MYIVYTIYYIRALRVQVLQALEDLQRVDGAEALRERPELLQDARLLSAEA